MAREKEGYRDCLKRLDEAFPGKETLNLKETAGWLGVDARTVKKRYGKIFRAWSKRDIRVCKTDLARAICI